MRLPLLLATLLHSTLASPLFSLSNTTDPKPWLITTLSTHTSSGRPGNTPYSYLFVSITDPNTISLGRTRFGDATFPPSTANCTLRWNAFSNDTAEDPFYHSIPCELANFNSPRWTMEVQAANVTGDGPNPTRDFTLKFEQEMSVILDEGIISKRFVGSVGFALGDNLALVCGASGVCGTWLKEERTPQLVVQQVKETRCIRGNCSTM
ncbi:hypothetical protein MFIFM68171_10176 [Madurella fahalii]|uniref:Uncharacterized protein n=1 Tax=Madurella fahalii TaxID=1157608 RepID=A0ABQ0GQE3_9PEZI